MASLRQAILAPPKRESAAVPASGEGSASKVGRLLRHAAWLAGFQWDWITAAWHGRRSPVSRAGLYRLGNDLWHYSAANTLPTVSLDEIFPGIRCDIRVRAGVFDERHRYYRDYAHHACVLAAICAHLRPSRVFEIGTYQGEMTVNFLLNAPAGATIFTLDLPEGGEETVLPVSLPERQWIRERGPDARFRGTAGGERIVRILCDSARFDPEPFAGSVDLIYVDGAHSGEYVGNDTHLAFRMLRPGGVIVWDDYNWYWRELTRVLQEEARTRAIRHIVGTDLAVYVDQ